MINLIFEFKLYKRLFFQIAQKDFKEEEEK